MEFSDYFWLARGLPMALRWLAYRDIAYNAEGKPPGGSPMALLLRLRLRLRLEVSASDAGNVDGKGVSATTGESLTKGTIDAMWVTVASVRFPFERYNPANLTGRQVDHPNQQIGSILCNLINHENFHNSTFPIK